MNAMYFLDFVKCANEGTRRIRDTVATMNLPVPEFEQKPSGHAAVRRDVPVKQLRNGGHPRFLRRTSAHCSSV